jgi:ferredoxin-NADP reductase
MNIYQGKLLLKSKGVVARDTLKFRFEPLSYESLDGAVKKEGKLDFQAGQFLSLQFTDTAWRAYSIASAPNEDLIELVVRLVPNGVGSEALKKLDVGEDITFKGPFGHFGLSDNSSAELIFCGTGTGIAPLRSMILTEAKAGKPRPMTLLYGGRDNQDIAYLNELADWAPSLRIRLGLSRDEKIKETQARYNSDWDLAKCRITQFLENRELSDNLEFYICGNGSMVKSVEGILEEKIVEKSRVFMERFN